VPLKRSATGKNADFREGWARFQLNASSLHRRLLHRLRSVAIPRTFENQAVKKLSLVVDNPHANLRSSRGIALSSLALSGAFERNPLMPRLGHTLQTLRIRPAEADFRVC